MPFDNLQHKIRIASRKNEKRCFFSEILVFFFLCGIVVKLSKKRDIVPGRAFPLNGNEAEVKSNIKQLIPAGWVVSVPGEYGIR